MTVPRQFALAIEEPLPARYVNLTLEQMRWAVRVGCRRHLAAVLRGYGNQHGLSDNGDLLNYHIEGACGELAAALALGVEWEARVNNFKEPDIGTRTQVRTRSRHDYDLLVRDKDADDQIFVHVTGKSPDFVVWGWIFAADARFPAWSKTWGNRPPAYFVGQDFLRPLCELEGLVL